MSGSQGEPDPRAVIREGDMTRFQVVVVAICVLICALDGFDVLVVAFTASAIARDFGLGPANLGVLFRGCQRSPACPGWLGWLVGSPCHGGDRRHGWHERFLCRPERRAVGHRSAVAAAAKPGGRPRTTCLRGVLDAVFYLLRAGCQWRLLPRCFPPWGTVYHYFRLWQRTGLWVRLHRAVYASARASAGRPPCPSLVIMDGQSVKTTERGGTRGFDGHELIRGRKRHILVDTLGLPIASRVEPASMPDQKASARLLGGLRPRFPAIRTVVADAGHRSRKLARDLLR
jgi:transposase